ncbi:MAG: DedA family protein [Acidimicrobiales bacterium]
MLNSLVHGLLSIRGWAAYVIPAALCFGEAAIFLGFFIPGEIAVVYGGVLASQHHVSLPIMLAGVVVAAVLGGTTGYFVGRLFGPALLRRRPLRDNESVERTRQYLQRRGGPAVFFGRFFPVVRAMMPGMAGASELSFQTFLFFNVLGGLVWGIAFTLVGFLAGESYQRVLKVIGGATTGLLVAAVVIVLVLMTVRHVRRLRGVRSGHRGA